MRVVDDRIRLPIMWLEIRTDRRQGIRRYKRSMTFNDETYRIERLHKSLKGGSRFIGRDSQEEPVELLVCTDEALIDERLERNARKPDVFPKLRIRTQSEKYAVAIFELTQGTTAIGKLAQARSNRAVNDGTDLAERIVVPIAQLVERLHEDNLTLGAHDPAEIWMSESGEVSLLDLPLLDETRTESSRRVVPGFSPPETYGRCGGILDEQADVFFIGILMYHALIRVPMPSSVGLIDERLPPPGLFHPRVQPDISAVTRKSTSLIRANR